LLAFLGMEVVIGVNGWLWHMDEVTSNWSIVRDLHPGAELYSLAWQSEELECLGKVRYYYLTLLLAITVLESLINNSSV
jgi:hypothetical protein